MLSISQSLVKNYWKYKEGKYCGIALHKIDILKEKEREPTERMSLGHYFEYLCTGATLRDGTAPETPSTKGGKPNAGALKMQEQAKRFKLLVKEKGIEILDTGVVLEYMPDGAGFKMKGVLDVECAIDNDKCILDIKSSGLIGDEWKEFGWHKGTFNMRKFLTIQVVFYKYLAWKIWGIEDVPFYFAVHSSTNEVDSIFWRVDLQDFEVAMNHFEDMVFEVADELKNEMEFGFTPYPDVKECSQCPLFESCAHAIKVAETEVVTIDGIFE